jgi:hypothetical protein
MTGSLFSLVMLGTARHVIPFLCTLYVPPMFLRLLKMSECQKSLRGLCDLHGLLGLRAIGLSHSVKNKAKNKSWGEQKSDLDDSAV